MSNKTESGLQSEKAEAKGSIRKEWVKPRRKINEL